MTTVQSNAHRRSDGKAAAEAQESAAKDGRLHRIRVVRRQQGFSLRAVARQFGTSVREVKKQERETTDLQLTDLYNWQRILDVPVSELLVDPEMALSHPVKERAQLLRLMKTAAAILERSRSVAVRRMAQALVDQLVEMMPELEFVSGWHAVGQRRSLEDYGRVVERRLPDDLLHRQRSD